MGTGQISLFPGGVLPDNSGSGNNAAALSYEVSTGTQTTNTPKESKLILLFDGVTDEHALFTRRTPSDYVSGGTLKGKYKMVSATSGNVRWKGGQVTSTDESTDDDVVVFVAADAVTSAVPGTQGQIKEFSIPLTTTGMAANKKISLFFGRDPDHADDANTTDAILIELTLEYTN